MSLGTSAVMILCIYPILWVMIAAFLAITRKKGTLVMNHTLPPEALDDFAVRSVIRGTRRRLWLSGIVLSVFVIFFFFIPYESVALTAWLSWSLFAIAVPYLVWLGGSRKIKKLMAERQWPKASEDAHWFGCMIYYNPSDSHRMVDMRLGKGTTFNFAYLGAKLLAVFCILCLASLPFFGAWLIWEDFTPISVSVSVQALELDHCGSNAEISYDEVEEVALIKEMPSHRRTSGYEMTWIDKGRFKVEGYGRCRVYVDSRDDAILVLKTADETFLVSLPEEKTAKEVIRHIPL